MSSARVNIIRKLNNKRHWDAVPGLREDDVQADALGDLATSSNRLSVFCSNDEAETNRICAALALARDHLSQVDFAILPSEAFEELSIAVKEEEGKTPDEMVNKLHRDLVVINAGDLLRLARWIAGNGQIRRWTDAQVKQIVGDSLKSGFVALESLRATMQESLRKRGIL